MIIIKPIGGLANRMRAMNSAIFLSRKVKKNLIILWNKNRELNCPLNKLFHLPKIIKIIQYRNQNIIGRMIETFFRLISDTILDDERLKVFKKEICNLENLTANKTIYIESCFCFYYYDNFDNFVLVNEVKEIVDKYITRFNDATIGIHIRRVDNKKAKEVSQTKLFIELMNSEIKKNNKTIFFLSTDSPEEENLLKEIFGNRILSREKELDRNSIKGIQDALVDLFCLANTQKIFGSYWSSFSTVASQIKKIDKIIVGMESFKEI